MAISNNKMALVCKVLATSSVLVAVAAQAQDVSFIARRDFNAGPLTYSVAVGDFNGDGVQDLVVATGPSNNVSVLLGNGDGTFQAPRNFFAGQSPQSVAVGDFNRDGAQDLAVANYFSAGISVLLGNGDGSFQPPRNLRVESGAVSIAVGDFNSDRLQDLAVSRYCLTPRCGTGNASVVLGNGDGTFQSSRDYVVGRGAGTIAVGDFNADRAQDLAIVSGSNSISVLVGNGDGSFRTPRTFGPGGGSIAVGDFNRTGCRTWPRQTRAPTMSGY